MPCVIIFLRHSSISSAVKKLHLLQRSQVCRRYVSPPPSAAPALLWNLSDLPHRFHDAFTTTESDAKDNATRLTMGARYVPRTRLNPPLHYTGILQPHCLLPTTLHFFLISSPPTAKPNRIQNHNFPSPKSPRKSPYFFPLQHTNRHNLSHRSPSLLPARARTTSSSLSLSLARARERVVPFQKCFLGRVCIITKVAMIHRKIKPYLATS
jgi:hypothetical protein